MKTIKFFPKWAALTSHQHFVRKEEKRGAAFLEKRGKKRRSILGKKRKKEAQHSWKKKEKKRRSILGKKRIFNRKRGKKEEHSFGQKKTKTDLHNNTTNSIKLARYQYRLNMN
jgi:hypothetical protein